MEGAFSFLGSIDTEKTAQKSKNEEVRQSEVLLTS